jgi:predicted nucleotidyltransferase
MELAHPFRVVTPTVDGDVLRVLALADASFTASQVQKLIGDRSVAGVRNCLERLHTQGMVLRSSAGKSYLFRLNREHLAAPAVGELARLKERLINSLKELVSSWQVTCAYSALFGSAARGDMRVSSDIDLFVVRRAEVSADDEVWTNQLMELSRRVHAWTGNDANVLEYGWDELQRSDSNDPILNSIAREGVFLVGDARYRKLLASRAKVSP